MDNQTPNQDLQATVTNALLKAMGQINAMTGQPGPAAQQQGLGQSPAVMPPAPQGSYGGIPNPTGWSVPVEADIGGTTVTVYVQFPPQFFPQYQQIVAAMIQAGWQVRAYAKNQGRFGNGNGWADRGGYYRNGYGRRY